MCLSPIEPVSAGAPVPYHGLERMLMPVPWRGASVRIAFAPSGLLLSWQVRIAAVAATSLPSAPCPENLVNGPDFSKSDLIPVIAQDDATGDVLMLAYMNDEAYQETLKTGRVCYFSRSRNKLWRKGEESGNVQEVKGIFFDCDADTLLVKVNQIGDAACHEGYRSCFFRQVVPEADQPTIVGERIFDPKEVYKK